MIVERHNLDFKQVKELITERIYYLQDEAEAQPTDLARVDERDSECSSEDYS